MSTNNETNEVKNECKTIEAKEEKKIFDEADLTAAPTPFDTMVHGELMQQAFRLIHCTVLTERVLAEVLSLVDFKKDSVKELKADVQETAIKIIKVKTGFVDILLHISNLIDNVTGDDPGGLKDEIDYDAKKVNANYVAELTGINKLKNSLTELSALQLNLDQIQKKVDLYIQHSGQEKLKDSYAQYEAEAKKLLPLEAALQNARRNVFEAQAKLPDLFGTIAACQQVIQDKSQNKQALQSEIARLVDEEAKAREAMGRAGPAHTKSKFLWITYHETYDASFDQARQAANRAEWARLQRETSKSTTEEALAVAKQRLESAQKKIDNVNAEIKTANDSVAVCQTALTDAKAAVNAKLKAVEDTCESHGGGSVGHVVKVLTTISRMFSLSSDNNTLRLFVGDLQNRLDPFWRVVTRFNDESKDKMQHYNTLIRSLSAPKQLAPVQVMKEKMRPVVLAMIEPKGVKSGDSLRLLLEE